MDETPYLTELQRLLSKDSEAKPLSMLMKQRQFLVTSLLEYICTPVVLVLVLAWNCVRETIMPHIMSNNDIGPWLILYYNATLL